MHSRARGKSGSKKPIKRIPAWSPYKEKEVEKLVLKHAKAGKNPSEIGMILRDNYGIHNIKALTNQKVTAILDKNKLSKTLPEDLIALIKKMIAVRAHLEKNKQDQSAGRGMILTSSKIRRIVKYYKRVGKLPVDWTLDMERLKMYVQ